MSKAKRRHKMGKIKRIKGDLDDVKGIAINCGSALAIEKESCQCRMQRLSMKKIFSNLLNWLFGGKIDEYLDTLYSDIN